MDFRRTPELERAWLFEATLRRSGRHDKTRRRLARRYRIAAHYRRVAWNTNLYGLTFEQARPEVRKHLAPFLLDETSDAHDGFDQALRAARRELIRRRLPRYDLLVLDEAHKLKNPSSKRFQYLEQLLIGRFETMLFLTATPFQIDLKELAAVFRLLGSASGRGSEKLAATAQQVIEHANRYRQRFDELEQVWRFCPSERACAASDPGSLDAHEQLLHGAFSRALESRDALAGELVKVMLRERRSRIIS